MSYAPTIRSLHTLLSKRGLMDDKRDIIREHTSGRTDSARALTHHELETLVKALDVNLPQYAPTCPIRQRMIRKLYALARQLGWHVAEQSHKNFVKVDTARLNAWCVKYGAGHAKPADCGIADLATMVTQLERYVNTDTERIAK